MLLLAWRTGQCPAGNAEIVAQAVADVGMADYADSEPSNLSGGQKQRVAIAGILAVKPQVIILDESTSMLDPEGKEQILDLVRKIKEDNNLTVISITHDLEEAAGADQVLVLDDGQLLDQGKPEEIFFQGGDAGADRPGYSLCLPAQAALEGTGDCAPG